jgi:hypothetical protein
MSKNSVASLSCQKNSVATLPCKKTQCDNSVLSKNRNVTTLSCQKGTVATLSRQKTALHHCLVKKTTYVATLPGGLWFWKTILKVQDLKFLFEAKNLPSKRRIKFFFFQS